MTNATLLRSAVVVSLAALAMATPSSADGNKMFKKPKIDGISLDYCRTWATNCGQPAATVFCKQRGYASAGVYSKWKGAGKTKVIGSGEICNAPDCDSFYYIVCVPAKKGVNVDATVETDFGDVN